MLNTRPRILLSISITVLATAPIHSADPADQLNALLVAGHWNELFEICETIPAREAVETRPEAPKPASYFSEIAVRCAIASEYIGERRIAEWWWYTAAHLDHQAARSAYEALLGLRSDLPRPPTFRGPVSTKVSYDPKSEILTPGGEALKGQHAERKSTDYPRDLIPKLPEVERARVRVELVSSPNGAVREPVLLSAQALPLNVFCVLMAMRDWTFEPARVDGEAVDSIVALTNQYRTTRN